MYASSRSSVRRAAAAAAATVIVAAAGGSPPPSHRPPRGGFARVATTARGRAAAQCSTRWAMRSRQLARLSLRRRQADRCRAADAPAAARCCATALGVSNWTRLPSVSPCLLSRRPPEQATHAAGAGVPRGQRCPHIMSQAPVGSARITELPDAPASAGARRSRDACVMRTESDEDARPSLGRGSSRLRSRYS